MRESVPAGPDLPGPDPFAPPPGRDGAPAFAEPWQAELLAMAFSLAEAGVFSRTEWSRALGAALEAARSGVAPESEESYYAAALDALQALLATTGAASPAAVAERTEAWRRAYLATPHGEPVTLERG